MRVRHWYKLLWFVPLLFCAPLRGTDHVGQVWTAANWSVGVFDSNFIVFNLEARLGRGGADLVQGGAGFGWHLTKSLKFSFGAALFVVPAAKVQRVETRAWENLSLSHKIGKSKLAHRLLAEQRFFDNSSSSYRIRYRLAWTSAPFWKNFFFRLSEEVLFSLKEAGNIPSGLEQNRVQLGFGIHLGKSAEFSIGYMNQWIFTTTNNDIMVHVGMASLAINY